jgi:ligand-binding SRPBCC domain-containing protein
MRIYRLKRTQFLPVSMNTAWQFFSDPGNLPEITPPWLGLRLTQKTPESVYAGMIISYRLMPLPYLTVNWTTEITHLKAPDFFVDEQRFGPYKFWHHQHLFKAVGNRTEMTDIVHYAMGFGMLGDLVHRFIVSPRLNNIFDFRYEKLKQIFS